MLVTKENFTECIQKIKDENYLSIDTETTGLKPYQGARLFSIIVGTTTDVFYFNYNENGASVLDRDTILEFSSIFLNVLKTVFMANAKFDMHIFEQEGVSDFKCQLHDVLSLDRLVYNDHIGYSLEKVANRYGYKKDNSVEEYISKNHLWEWVTIPGKLKREKNKFYSKVPFEIMHKYGEMDARITFDIGIKQIEYFSKNPLIPMRKVDMPVEEMEKRLLGVCYRMEREGILIDKQLCENRVKEETLKYEQTAREFHDKTGHKFIDSGKHLGPIFTKAGFTLPKTDKGQDSITDKWLETIRHPLGDLVRRYREHYKTANFYGGFLWFLSEGNLIHANAKTGGTRTGRLSYSDPNMQQVPDSEVREAILAPQDFCLVSIDFDQQEYIMMLDYADETELIEKVKGGLDIHTATAEMMGTERKPAKTLNFLLLYGGGTVKLALALYPMTLGESALWKIWKEHKAWELSEEEKLIVYPENLRKENLDYLLKAEELRDLYFEKLPNVRRLINRGKTTAKDRGYIKTWAGRRLYFKENFHYKAPNGLIQGGGADVGKYAMIKIDKFLSERKSKLIAVVHDENLFKIHKDELNIVPEIQRLMEETFPHKHIKLTTSVSYSWKNWWEMKEGLPEKTGNNIQGKST